MARHYLDWLDRIGDAQKTKSRLPQFASFEWVAKPAVPVKGAEIAVTRAKEMHDDKRSLNGQRIEATGGKVQRGNGQQFDVAFKDGTTARYRAWTDTPYAHRGMTEIVVPGAASDATLAAAIRVLERLGVDAAAASPAALDIAYLRRQAAASGLDKDASYKGLVDKLAARKASVEDQVRELVAFWEKRLGVADLRSSPRWNPDGDYQPGVAGGLRGGRRVHWRFDVTDEDIAREMGRYRVYHRNTGGRSTPQMVDMVLTNGGHMMAQTERMRTGTSSSGMSQGQDVNTGGAQYFFTRVRELRSPSQIEAGFYWRPELLRRLDAVTYDSDMYGRMTGDTRAKNHQAGIQGWKKAANHGSNETLFKGSVSLTEHLDFVVVRDAKERAELIATFRRHGVERIGGAPVESRIHIAGQAPVPGAKEAPPKPAAPQAPASPKQPPQTPPEGSVEAPGSLPLQTFKNGKPKVPAIKAIAEAKKLSQADVKSQIGQLSQIVGDPKAAQLIYSRLAKGELWQIIEAKDASAVIVKYGLAKPLAKLGAK